MVPSGLDWLPGHGRPWHLRRTFPARTLVTHSSLNGYKFLKKILDKDIWFIVKETFSWKRRFHGQKSINNLELAVVEQPRR